MASLRTLFAPLASLAPLAPFGRLVALTAPLLVASVAFGQQGTPAPSAPAPTPLPAGTAAPEQAPPPPAPPPVGAAPALPPPGYAPPAYPPGAYPPGAYPPGAYPPNAYPPGYNPYYPPGAYAPALPPEPPPPIAPSKRRGYHLHDGFFFRFGLGVANHRSTLSGPLLNVGKQPLSGAEVKLRGTGMALDVALGGSPIDGLLIGADLGGHVISTPSLSGDPVQPLRNVTYSRLAAMVDWYPSPAEGLHFQGSLGFGTLAYTYKDIDTLDPNQLTGLAWSLGIGYGGWIGADWSLGALLRLDGASLRGDALRSSGEQRMSLLAPALLIELTYQ